MTSARQTGLSTFLYATLPNPITISFSANNSAAIDIDFRLDTDTDFLVVTDMDFLVAQPKQLPCGGKFEEAAKYFDFT